MRALTKTRTICPSAADALASSPKGISSSRFTCYTDSPAYTTITDGNGNLALQAVLTVTANVLQTVTANYYDDANFTSKQSNAVDIVITDTTFTIDPIADVNISTAGQTGIAMVTFNPVKWFGGNVSITCTLPASMK